MEQYIELEDMRNQLASLKKKLENQEIINDKLLRKTIATKLGGLQEYRNKSFIISSVALLALIYVWRMLNLSNWFLGYAVAVVILLVLVDFNIHRKFGRYDIFNTDLPTILKELKSAKRRNMQSYWYSIPLVIINIVWFLYEINAFSGWLKPVYIIMMVIVVIIGGFIAYLMESSFFRMCDEIIREIEE